VGREKLEIFISGKEEELKCEREIIRELIINLGFEPRSSEDRPASNQPIEKKYPKEVIESDVYVGVFGKYNSPASINEYRIAHKQNKPTLIFFKEIDGERDGSILEFLNELKPIKVFSRFRGLGDLRKEVHKALISTVTDYFRNISPTAARRDIEMYMAVGSIENFEIVLVSNREQIINELHRGTLYSVKTTVRGTGKYMFVTLMMLYPDNKQVWWPDTSTVDLDADKGKMELDNEKRDLSWDFPIYADAKQDEYILFLGMYQDTYDLPTVNRQLVDYKQKKFQVI
jgi:hypothetical protein